MSRMGASIDAQMLYNFAERGEWVEPEEFAAWGKEFFFKIKVKNIHKRLAIYIDENGKNQVKPVCELSEDMLAWAGFLHCFFEQKMLTKDRLKERYGIENNIAVTLSYIPIMEKYRDMGEKDMEVIDLEDVMTKSLPYIRKYKGIEEE